MVEAEPSQEQYRKYLGDGLRHRGIVLQKCSRPAEAVLAFRNSIELLEGLANPRPGDVYDIACSQSLLSGAAAEAGSRPTRPWSACAGSSPPAGARRP